MQPGLHERCRQSCMGPPAPKNGAIRMTVFFTTHVIRHRNRPCQTTPQRLPFQILIDTRLPGSRTCNRDVSPSMLNTRTASAWLSVKCVQP